MTDLTTKRIAVVRDSAWSRWGTGAGGERFYFIKPGLVGSHRRAYSLSNDELIEAVRRLHSLYYHYILSVLCGVSFFLYYVFQTWADSAPDFAAEVVVLCLLVYAPRALCDLLMKRALALFDRFDIEIVAVHLESS